MKSSGFIASFSSSFTSSSDLETGSAPSRGLAGTATAQLVQSRSPKGIMFWDGLGDAGQRHFLDSCFLCRKSLGGNRDIFMYRGNMPFCSEECRQEQIEMDEGKEKNWKLSLKASSRKDSTASATGSGGGSESPSKSHKVHVRSPDTAVAAG